MGERRLEYELHRRLKVIVWSAAVLVGALLSWKYRNVIDNDTISHLDMADAYFRGDWKMAVNGYWNPLYAWILGLVMHTLKSSPYWEYPTVHLVVFVIFLFALGCFEFFLRELIRFHNSIEQDETSEARQPVVSETIWMVLGYTIFLWSSIFVIGLGETNPDMLVAAFVYLAAGFLLRMRRGAATRTDFALFGLALGLGYLTKQVMFPLAFVFLGVGLFSAGNIRRAVPGILVALVAFIFVAAPLVLALSVAKSRFTFGESGRFNYALRVNNLPSRHWQGEHPGSGRPLHPTHKIFDNPATYEFATPIGGTYPLWYDITYWYEGFRVHPEFSAQAKVLRKSLKGLVGHLMGLNGSIVVGLMVMLFASSSGLLVLKNLLHYFFLILPPVCGLGLYSLVGWMEGRYIGPFVTILALSLFFAMSLRQPRGHRRLVRAVAAVIMVMFAIDMVPKMYSAIADLLHPRANVYWQVANGLNEMGLRPGDKIASVSYANVNNVQWARLARVHIIAEVYHTPYENPGENDFWKADSSAQQRILQAFAASRARVVVSDEEPRGSEISVWHRIGTTNYYAYFLNLDKSGRLYCWVGKPSVSCEPKRGLSVAIRVHVFPGRVGRWRGNP